jgi:hypothetical protein
MTSPLVPLASNDLLGFAASNISILPIEEELKNQSWGHYFYHPKKLRQRV